MAEGGPGISLGSTSFASCCTNFFFSDIFLSVFQEFGDHTSGNGLTSLSESEALSLQDGEGVHEFHHGGQVVSGHGHGDFFGEGNVDGAISSSDEALRSVAREERLGTATFIGLEDVNLSVESSADLERVRLGEAHSSLDLLLDDTTEQDSDVISSLSSVHLFVEGLDSSDGGSSVLSVNTDQVDIVVDLDLTLLNGSSHDCASSSNVMSRINGHKEILSGLTDGLLDGRVHSASELLHGLGTKGALVSVEGQQGTSLDKDCIITIVVVLGEKLSNFHLDELVHLFILDLIAFVQEDDDGLDSDLSAEQDVLTGLGHGTISS